MTARQIVLVAALLIGAAALGFGLSRWYRESHPPPAPAVTAHSAANHAQMPAGKQVPEVLPTFSLRDRDNQLRTVAPLAGDWNGHSLAINFWATWCPPCRREIPLLKKLNAQWRPQGIQIIGVAVDFRDAVLAYAKEAQIDYPLLIGEQDGLDAASAFGAAAVGFPFTVFTDNQGRIVTLYVGELHAEEAGRILTAVDALNDGKLTLAQARAAISAK